MDTIDKNPFKIQPFKGPHSHLIASCVPIFLADETGHWKRVAKNEGHQHLYSPPLGHTRELAVGPPPETPPSVRHPLCPLLGHSRSPSGARPPSFGHPSRCPFVLLAQWVLRATLVTPSGHSV
jgi:hypothetical protein